MMSLAVRSPKSASFCTSLAKTTICIGTNYLISEQLSKSVAYKNNFLLFVQNQVIRIMEKKIITTNNAPAPIGPYNQAVLVNNTLYISGQVCIDPQTGNLKN